MRRWTIECIKYRKYIWNWFVKYHCVIWWTITFGIFKNISSIFSKQSILYYILHTVKLKVHNIIHILTEIHNSVPASSSSSFSTPGVIRIILFTQTTRANMRWCWTEDRGQKCGAWPSSPAQWQLLSSKGCSWPPLSQKNTTHNIWQKEEKKSWLRVFNSSL